jgi:lipoprotein-releasing system permease protein
VLGTALGLAVARLVDTGQIITLDASVYFIDHLPVQVDPLDLIIIVAASISVAVLATLYPAGQAARLHPVEAIRYE